MDTEKALSDEILNGILGFPVIEDNVHFSVRGQYRLGLQLALEMAEHNWIAPKAEWRFEPSELTKKFQKN